MRTTLDGADIRDLWGTDSSFLIAATQSEGVFRFDGVAWQQWEPIQAVMVSGTSTSDIWLADWSGWLHHYDGLGWSKTLVAAGFWTRAVAAIRPDDVYVASSDGRIAHFDGAAWNIESSPAAPPLLAITASPSGNVIWAVGEAGAILRLDRRR